MVTYACIALLATYTVLAPEASLADDDSRARRLVGELGGKVNQIDNPSVRKGAVSVALSATQCSDQDLALVGRIRGLWMIDLSGTKVTHVGLAHLRTSEGLECVVLPNNAGATCAKELKGFRSLKYVAAHDSAMDDDGVAVLAECAGLESIDLRSSGITNKGLAYLRRLKCINYLNINMTKVTNLGLKELAGLKTLRVLCLGDTSIGDTALQHIAAIRTSSAWTSTTTKSPARE